MLGLAVGPSGDVVREHHESAMIASFCSSDQSPAIAAAPERAGLDGEAPDHASNCAGTPRAGPASASR